MKFSVVVATWNEGVQIGACLKRLRQISQDSPMEVIVVDGRSDDRTAEAAREWADQVLVLDKPNPGAQLHAGAQKASGDLLFFLPADSQPPGNWQQVLEHSWLKTQPRRVAATAFAVDYGSSRALRLASAASNFWVSWRHVATAEHGLCTTPELYREAGGFPTIPYRHDVLLSQRLSRLGDVILLDEVIRPAARRLHRHGPLRCGWDYFWGALRFKLGADPEALWRRTSGP